MDYFVFARIRDYYLLLGEQRDSEFLASTQGLFFSLASLSSVLDEKTCRADELTQCFDKQISFPKPQYNVGIGDAYLLLMPSSDANGSIFKSSNFEAASVEARQRVTEFALKNKEDLINALFASNTSLGEYVQAWADYFFCDHYSLWIFNRFTNAFTCSTSSFDISRNFIFESEASALNLALESDYDTESRAPTDDVVAQPESMQTMNRVKLQLGYNGTIGVVTFYSRQASFKFNEMNNREIRNSIETKYLQVHQQAHSTMDRINQQFIEAYKAGQLNLFLFSIAGEVKHSFQAEACSIFLVNDKNTHLDLVATSDNKINGEPSAAYQYTLGDDSPTVRVFVSQTLDFSYDLATDDPKSDGYNESTDHAPENWIGAPIMSAGQCFGVIRIRNKYKVDDSGMKTIINIRSGDFLNLLSLCSNLANLIRIESLFNETESKLKTTNASIDEMNDFNKVFLHEIRTPISKFTMAPEIIKRTLGKKELSQENLDKVMKQLDDIQVMGDRLEFIAKTFNFNEIVTRRDFESLSVMRDIVFPVINITRAYLRKQYDIDIQLNATGLKSTRVYGDKTLLNIVFNTLIDNAGKYSVNTRKPISISGAYGPKHEYFDITVSNYGLEIHENERKNLFKKGVRGKEVIKHGIGGTGIGLHLAQQIMVEGGGELLLTSIKDPVTFVLRVPTQQRGIEP